MKILSYTMTSEKRYNIKASAVCVLPAKYINTHCFSNVIQSSLYHVNQLFTQSMSPVFGRSENMRGVHLMLSLGFYKTRY